MTTLQLNQPLKNQTESFWMSKIRKFLKERISARVKRLIFLASVFALIENVNAPTKDTMTKLNKVLKLAHNNDAIAFPMYIHSWLWKNCNTHDKLVIDDEEVTLSGLLSELVTNPGTAWKPARYDVFAQYLTTIAPNWIIYGPNQMIAKDLEVLLNKCAS